MMMMTDQSDLGTVTQQKLHIPCCKTTEYQASKFLNEDTVAADVMAVGRELQSGMVLREKDL